MREGRGSILSRLSTLLTFVILRISFLSNRSIPIKARSQLTNSMPNSHPLGLNVISHFFTKYIRVIFQCCRIVGRVDKEPDEYEGYCIQTAALASELMEKAGSDEKGGGVYQKRPRSLLWPQLVPKGTKRATRPAPAIRSNRRSSGASINLT